MIKELVSIIIPVYNAEKYLESCIESLINQTYKNLEIIIINDGSTDNSGKICDEFEKLYSIVKVYHQYNEGVSIARNNGLLKATGEYIIFIDSDDYVNNNYVEILINTIKNSKVDMAICQYSRYNLSSETCNIDEPLKIEKIKANYIYNHMLNNESYDGYLWNKVFLKKIIDDNRILFPKEIIIWEDMYFVIRYLKCIDTVGIINKSLYYYRSHENNTTKGLSYKKVISMVNVCKMFVDLEKDENSLYYKCSRKLLFSYLLLMCSFGIKSKEISRKELKKSLKESEEIMSYIDINWKQSIKLITLKLKSLYYKMDIIRRKR